jgi:hypothetical protein
MKILVNLFQLAVVAAILYPVYYVWDTGRVEHFCQEIKVGMSVEELNKIADEKNITLNVPEALGAQGGQWMTAAESNTFFDDKACIIKGAVDKIASVKLVDIQ